VRTAPFLSSGAARCILHGGHELIETTQIYLDATLALKQQALEKTTPLTSKAGRYRAGDRLMRLLTAL
jgi:hypothetical protein